MIQGWHASCLKEG